MCRLVFLYLDGCHTWRHPDSFDAFTAVHTVSSCLNRLWLFSLCQYKIQSGKKQHDHFQCNKDCIDRLQRFADEGNAAGEATDSALKPSRCSNPPGVSGYDSPPGAPGYGSAPSPFLHRLRRSHGAGRCVLHRVRPQAELTPSPGTARPGLCPTTRKPPDRSGGFFVAALPRKQGQAPTSWPWPPRSRPCAP